MLTPLTEQEKVFSEQHHKLVLNFLNKFQLDFCDFYDVAIFGYIRAVKRWLSSKELQKYSFSTIAFRCMSTCVRNEKIKKRIQTTSLNEKLAEDFTFEDIITYDNLNYMLYEYNAGGEDMKILYNVIIPQKNSQASQRGIKSEELVIIEKFLANDDKNICFEYDTAKEATKKSDVISKSRKRNKLEKIYKYQRRGKCIYIEKTEKWYELRKLGKEKGIL